MTTSDVENPSLSCPETTTAAPTTTEPAPVDEPPSTTVPAEDAPPTVATTTTRRRTRAGHPARPATTAPKPATTTAPAPSGAGTYDGATPFGRPSDNGTPKLSGGPYVFPVIGPTSFSDTWGAARADVDWHHGVDVFASVGAPVVAVADGVLFSVGWNTIGGWRLWLRDRDGNFFYYAHLSAFAASAAEGAAVRAGTVVGFVGNSGDASGTPYHLHFEIHPTSLLSLGYDGAVDPFPYLSAWRGRPSAPVAGYPRAGASRVAREPGAILVGFTDISSGDGLSSAPLEEVLGQPIRRDAFVVAPQSPPPTATKRAAIPPPSETEAQVARSLDSEATRAAGAGPNVWNALSLCESGGNWSADTGNGYVGGLQFLPQTWSAHGGTQFAASAEHATREEQIAVAERVLHSQGWGAWPACSSKLRLGALVGNP